MRCTSTFTTLEKELKGLVVQATGLEREAQVVKSTLGSFKALRDFADFNAEAPAPKDVVESPANGVVDGAPPLADERTLGALNLGYTINLHLPATSDIAVFNAIFKSLRETCSGSAMVTHDEALKLFAMSNQLLENDLDRVEAEHVIDLRRGHSATIGKDEAYYPTFRTSGSAFPVNQTARATSTLPLKGRAGL